MPDIISGKKPFEVRLDDRHYEVGDTLHLMAWNRQNKEYTGWESTAEITYVLKGGQFGIEQGYVVMGIKILSDNSI